MRKLHKNQFVFDKVSKKKAKIKGFENGEIVITLRKKDGTIYEATRKRYQLTSLRKKNKNIIPVRVKKLFEDVQLGVYKTVGSAGFDLHAYIPEEKEITLQPNERILVSTGLAFAIPIGYELQLRPRSGLAVEYGITLTNSPGTIDSDYRGEVKVILHNTGDKPFVFKHGDRIAQAVLNEVKKAKFIVVDELDKTKRGEGGFGHTGV